MSDTHARIEALQRKHADLAQRKATLAGQLQARKEQLAALVKEIKDAGYDPKTLAEQRDKVKAELDAAIDKYEADLTEVERALSTLPAS